MLREGVVDGGFMFTDYLCETCQSVQCDLDWGAEFGEGELLKLALEYESAQRGGAGVKEGVQE